MYVYAVRRNHTKKPKISYIRTLLAKQILQNEKLEKRSQVMRMRGRDYLLLDLETFLGFWRRISMSAKVAKGFIQKMGPLGRKSFERKHVEGPLGRRYGSTSQFVFRVWECCADMFTLL